MIQGYFKDFDSWNQRKKKLDGFPEKQFSEREIWWVSLGVNVGVEIDGKNFHFERPILIVKKISRYALWALPIGSTTKKGDYFHSIKVNGVVRTISLHQIRLISSRRLLRKTGKIGSLAFLIILKKIEKLLPIKRIPLWLRGISIAFRHDEDSITRAQKFARSFLKKLHLKIDPPQLTAEVVGKSQIQNNPSMGESEVKVTDGDNL